MNPTLKWKLVVGFILAFLAGAATGGFFAARQSHHWRADFSHHRHALAERMRTRLEAKLNLTPAQIEKAAPIFEQAAAKLEKIRTDTGREVEQVMAEANRALSPELTDEQRAKLDALGKHAYFGPDLRKAPRRRGQRPSP